MFILIRTAHLCSHRYFKLDLVNFSSDKYSIAFMLKEYKYISDS